METTYFTIESRTNMHVGSGKSNYGVIDNLVQRDPTYQYPVINASSLKGGIKEFCHHNVSDLDMIGIFGSEKGSDGKTKHDSSRTGQYKFFDAMLLCIPVRSDKRAFVHITCPGIIEYLRDSLPSTHSLNSDLKSLQSVFENTTEQSYCFTKDLDGAVVEDYDIKTKYDATKATILTEALKQLFGYETIIVSDNVFKRLTNDLHLPVIARNHLENGESQNLWYEQVVPRLSRFWSMCIHPEDKLFQPVLFHNDRLIQLGANGSVGYGYCTFKKI